LRGADLLMRRDDIDLLAPPDGTFSRNGQTCVNSPAPSRQGETQ
jgi:hypothetical protein